MPYPNEHACRLEDPGKFKRFTRVERKSSVGKTYSVLFGWMSVGGKEISREQAYRYPKDTWNASQARAHCKSHDGRFEKASEKTQEMNYSDPDQNPQIATICGCDEDK